MHYIKTQSTLDLHLSTLPNSPPVMWQGTRRVPQAGTVELRPTLLMSPITQLTLEAVPDYEQRGVYQIDVFAPAGRGNGTLLSWADTIYEHYINKTLQSDGGARVRITSIDIGNIELEDAFTYVSLSINFVSYV